ncbi:hypothetical protein BBP40_010910 [Aspergillus hancockii]|nr:hypothetical protein BBP40_010910 [Aspergillus hancockii]
MPFRCDSSSYIPLLGEGVSDDPDGHGTHVLFGPDGESMLEGIPDDLGSLFHIPYKDGARIHTNSRGSGPFPGSSETKLPYTQGSEENDSFVWDHQDIAILFAVGNSATDRNRDEGANSRSIGSEAAAKNCITVGACENKRPTIKYRGQGPRFKYTYGNF